MTAQILAFPNFFRPASPHNEPCLILILPVVRIERFDCGEVSPLLRRRSRRLRNQFNPKFSGGTCSGGETI